MIEIEEINTNNHVSEISEFIQMSMNGTLFHQPKFLNYHASNKFPTEKYQIKNLLFKKKNQIMSFLPGRIITDDFGKKIYKSPFASSYGSFVFMASITFSELEELVRSTLGFLKNLSVSEIEMIPSTLCHCNKNQEKLNYLEYIFLKEGFTIGKTDIVLAHKINNKIEIAKQFHSKTRTELKQCFKYNLIVQITNQIDSQTYDILAQSQRNIGGKPTHTIEELITISRLYPEQFMILKSFYNDTFIAGIICFLITDKIINTFYIFDDINFRQYKPNHFNYYNALKWAYENNFDFVDFGPSSFGYSPHYPLIMFKEKFNTLPYLRKAFKLIN